MRGGANCFKRHFQRLLRGERKERALTTVKCPFFCFVPRPPPPAFYGMGAVYAHFYAPVKERGGGKKRKGKTRRGRKGGQERGKGYNKQTRPLTMEAAATPFLPLPGCFFCRLPPSLS